MSDPFTGDLQALQDANRRIAELEAQCAKADDGLLAFAREIIEKQKRIFELEENFRLSLEWLESVVGDGVELDNDAAPTLTAFRRVLEKHL